MIRRSFARFWLDLTMSVPLAVIAGCSDRTPTDPDSVPPAIQAAPGGAGGGATPQVNGTDPTKGALGTTLDVRVLGQNFASGAKVAFLLNGTATSHVKTNSTQFVSATELVANITIDEEAVLDTYDVQVTASGGKKPGVGIDLFTVVGALADFASNPQTGAAGLYHDGLGLYDRGTFLLNGASPSGNFNIEARCDAGRAFDAALPASWLTEFPADPGRISDCTGNGWESAQFHLPGLGVADCPDGSSCPIGGPHQPGSPNYGPDIFYYFNVDVNGDGRFRRGDASYNIVWVDAVFSVTQRGDDGVTPCLWHVVGNTAQLWKRDATPIDAAGQPVLLDVTVTRGDGPCGI